MLRIYFLQLWFNLSDPAVEESLYGSVSMRENASGVTKPIGQSGDPRRAPDAKDFTNQRYRWGKRVDESIKRPTAASPAPA